MLLGVVEATDPNSDAVRYSPAGGNESELFNIDETSGELYYVGAGEDYESGVTSYELTVRASDGTHASDTTVTVALGDVRGRSEPEGGDLPQDRTTTGLVLVDEGAVTGNIEMWWDLDWFAVELVAGRTYQIDFRGQPTGDGTLVDPFLYGVYDGDGRLIPGTTIPDGGTSHNSRLVFTVPGEGTYYIATSGNGTYPSGTGTYELEVRDVGTPVFAESGYRFALTENADGSVNRQSLGTVTATDPDGDGAVRYSLTGGNETELFAIGETSGELYYVGSGEDYESRVTSYELTVRASDAAHTVDTTVTVTVTDAPEAPAFAAERYAFALAENTGRERQPASAGGGDGDGPRRRRGGALQPDRRQRDGTVRHRRDERGALLRRRGRGLRERRHLVRAHGPGERRNPPGRHDGHGHGGRRSIRLRGVNRPARQLRAGGRGPARGAGDERRGARGRGARRRHASLAE